jgi:hypothetical protein
MCDVLVDHLHMLRIERVHSQLLLLSLTLPSTVTVTATMQPIYRSATVLCSLLCCVQLTANESTKGSQPSQRPTQRQTAAQRLRAVPPQHRLLYFQQLALALSLQ